MVETIKTKNAYLNNHLKFNLFLGLMVCILVFTQNVKAQSTSGDSVLTEVTLQQAVAYAEKRQPEIRQALIDEKITDAQIKSKLADWYPQLNFNYNLQHNFIVQKSFIGGMQVQIGSDNTSAGQFTVSQNIFNRDLILANRTQEDVRLQSKQMTSDDRINLAVNVTKAFYDILSTTQQIKVAESNIVRIERSLQDAYYQYQAGVTDKTDYKRATITLNNTKASKKSNEEQLKAKMEYLKLLMNYPVADSLNIIYDSLQMEREILLDTLQTADYKTRIEFRLLETQRRLLMSNIQYTKLSYLPTVSANGAYNLNFQNNNFGKLYNTNYPNSFAALTLSFPIFQGGKRKQNVRIAEFELDKNEQDIINLRNSINADYAQAIATYKSNLISYLSLKENVDLAKEVYDVIQLQYRSGIKAYLEVITSETDLRTAQINYYNALYQLLASKIDVQKALGQINY